MKLTKSQNSYFNKKTYSLTLVSYLPINKIKELIDSETKIKHFAYCVHDKDSKKVHTHIILNFWSDQTLLKYVKLFETTEVTIIEKQRIPYMFEYLIHNTENARAEGKFQYAISERVCDDINFFTVKPRRASVNVSEMINDVLVLKPRDFVSKYGYNALLNYDKIKTFANFCSLFD